MKAKQLLGEMGIKYEERLYFKQHATPTEVQAIVKRLPNGVADLLSTRSRRYKELNLAERDLSEIETIALLSAEPGLWRRPVIITAKGVQVGYNEDAIRALLS